MPRVPPWRERSLDKTGCQASPEAWAAPSMLESYQAEYAVGDASAEMDPEYASALARIQQHLSSEDSKAAVCLVCLESMEADAPVWHCNKSCHCVFHLLCIQAWARQQLQTAAARAATEADRGMKAEAAPPVWACPKCRHDYAAGDTPTEYRCCCGKEADPEFNAWLAPHTCGARCDQPLACALAATAHPHTCLLLCHPGPCPPCPRQVQADCFCGREAAKRRCGQAAWSCQQLCGKRLACGHRCPLRCHRGACPDCLLTAERQCQCGAEKRTVPCKVKTLQCGRVCGKQLSCGRHSCEGVCHAGACAPCPMQGIRTCPCGKAEFDSLPCTEATPSCGATCDKTLPCGAHSCEDRCHHGPCPSTCRAMITKSCECGRMQKDVPCYESVRCQRRCTNVRACQRHPCKRRCCSGNCPPCDQTCNRLLKCGNHRCPAACHPGACLPCPLTVSVTCACGTASYTLPCGSEKRAGPPVCHSTCCVPRVCRHAAQLPPHRCHFGPCPPCQEACSQTLSCGHPCSSRTCHDPQPSPVAAFSKPKPPPADALISHTHSNGAAALQDKSPVFQAIASAGQDCTELSTCPACMVPVRSTCVGGHVKQEQACSEHGLFSCGQECSRPLACGNHTCALACHAVATAEQLVQQRSHADELSRPCERCSRPCGRPRCCAHPCPEACHPGACPSCTVPVSVACYCGRTSIELPCTKQGGAEAEGTLSCTQPCHRMLPDCDHLCQSACHKGACPGPCLQPVTVRCDCRRLKSKMPCQEVRQKLAASGQLSRLEPSAAVKLLLCNAECIKAKVSKQKNTLVQGGQESPSETNPEPEPTSRPAGPALSRAVKRRAKREARDLEEEQAEHRENRHRLFRFAKQIGVWALLSAVALLMATYFAQGLAAFLKL